MKTVKITCDFCGRDLTESRAGSGFKLVLKCKPIPKSKDSKDLIRRFPSIDSTKHS